MIMAFIILINMLAASGCWDYKEVNSLAVVAGLAVDKDMESNKYKIAVEIINLESSKGESKIKSEILHCEGPTIFESVRNLIKKTGRKLYWSHAKVVIFGEGLAREGIGPALDWIVRDAEVRADMYVIVSREKTAEEILEFKTSIEELVSFQIAMTMLRRKSTENYKEEDIWHILNDFSEKGMSDVVPAVQRSIFENDAIPVISGSGVFKKDKLVGWLEGEETKNVLYVRDEIKDGLLIIENVEGTGNNVVFELEGNKTRVEVDYKNGKLIFSVDVKPQVVIAEINGSKDFISEKNRDKLARYADKIIEKRIKGTVEKVKNEYGSDTFKFGNLVERKMPDLWKDVSKNWENELKKAEVNVKVELNITGSATVMEPIKIEE